jgi:hypothetical protein
VASFFEFVTVDGFIRFSIFDTRNCWLVGPDQYCTLVEARGHKYPLVEFNAIGFINTFTVRLRCPLHSRSPNMSAPFYPWCVREVGLLRVYMSRDYVMTQ